MCVRQEAIVFIPSMLGYGRKGLENIIPPNANIVFQIQIVSIEDVVSNESTSVINSSTSPTTQMKTIPDQPDNKIIKAKTEEGVSFGTITSDTNDNDNNGSDEKGHVTGADKNDCKNHFENVFNNVFRFQESKNKNKQKNFGLQGARELKYFLQHILFLKDDKWILLMIHVKNSDSELIGQEISTFCDKNRGKFKGYKCNDELYAVFIYCNEKASESEVKKYTETLKQLIQKVTIDQISLDVVNANNLAKCDEWAIGSPALGFQFYQGLVDIDGDICNEFRRYRDGLRVGSKSEFYTEMYRLKNERVGETSVILQIDAIQMVGKYSPTFAKVDMIMLSLFQIHKFNPAVEPQIYELGNDRYGLVLYAFPLAADEALLYCLGLQMREKCDFIVAIRYLKLIGNGSEAKINYTSNNVHKKSDKYENIPDLTEMLPHALRIGCNITYEQLFIKTIKFCDQNKEHFEKLNGHFGGDNGYIGDVYSNVFVNCQDESKSIMVNGKLSDISETGNDLTLLLANTIHQAASCTHIQPRTLFDVTYNYKDSNYFATRFALLKWYQQMVNILIKYFGNLHHEKKKDGLFHGV